MTTKVVVTNDSLNQSYPKEIIVKVYNPQNFGIEVNHYTLKPGDTKSFYVYDSQSLDIVEGG